MAIIARTNGKKREDRWNEKKKEEAFFKSQITKLIRYYRADAKLERVFRELFTERIEDVEDLGTSKELVETTLFLEGPN